MGRKAEVGGRKGEGGRIRKREEEETGRRKLEGR